jgi:spore maturation protein CgeB
LWSGNFYPALKKLGHEIVESQADLLPTSRFMHVASGFTPEELAMRARTTEQIIAEVRAAQRAGPVHAFLSYFYNAHFDPRGFEELRHLGIPSINFYCNSTYQFGHVAAVAAKVDFSWHAERDARGLYLGAGGNPVWVQMGADPAVYHPVNDMERKAKACFIGQRYADRDRWAAALITAGVPLDLYGSGWGENDAATAQDNSCVYLGRVRYRPGSVQSYLRTAADIFRAVGLVRGIWRGARLCHYRSTTRRLTPLLRKAAKDRAMYVPETLAAYDVALNFSNVWSDGRPGSKLIPHVRLRDFEAPMCRTCYLTGHTDEIGEFYDLGKEIDTYRTPDELIDKTQYYLRHPAEAEKLREAGYLRARKDHTWERRFEELFRKIGVNANG